MSINACTLNGHTIDSLCSNRRQAIIDDLLGYVPPTQTEVPSGGYHVRDGTAANIFRNRPDRRPDNIQELDYITVDLFFDNQWYSQTHDITSGIQLVNVYDFKMLFMGIIDEDEIAVNIDDFHIREL